MDNDVVQIGEVAVKLDDIPVGTLGDMAAAQESLEIKAADFQEKAGMGYQIQIAYEALHRKWPEIKLADVRDLPMSIGVKVVAKVSGTETSPS